MEFNSYNNFLSWLIFLDDEGINVSGPDENDLLDNKLPDEDDDWVFRQELDFADDQFDNVSIFFRPNQNFS